MTKPIIGVIITMGEVLARGAQHIREVGLQACQLNCWDDTLYTPENAALLTQKLQGITVTDLWAGWPGPAKWNFYEGPATLGLVPLEYRARRIEALIRGAEFAAERGWRAITTHAGFIPENPATREYEEVVEALRTVAGRCHELGIDFYFETGQETPTTLLRTMQDMALPNLGVNLDPANLLLYGKANPVDAVGIYGAAVRGVHVKDGKYPTGGRDLGEETPVGEGMVNYPRLVEALKAVGFTGPYIIEREVAGPQQIAGILQARAVLEQLL